MYSRVFPHVMPHAFPMTLQIHEAVCYRICFDLLELGRELPPCASAAGFGLSSFSGSQTASRLAAGLFELQPRSEPIHAART